MGRGSEMTIGTPSANQRGMSRITINLPESTFELIKISAMKENRTIPAEIRTRLERTLREERGS